MRFPKIVNRFLGVSSNPEGVLRDLNASIHNGILDTEKIVEKIELGVSMARLTSNLVNASQIKWKKWKKDFEISGIWTPDFH